jgi:hypothetical protein
MPRLFRARRPGQSAAVHVDPPVPVEVSTTAKDLADLQARVLVADRTAELQIDRADAIQQTNLRLRAELDATDHRYTRLLAETDALRLRVGRDRNIDALDRALQTLQIYEDRLALYEKRPSNITCPRACCAHAPLGVPA